MDQGPVCMWSLVCNLIIIYRKAFSYTVFLANERGFWVPDTRRALFTEINVHVHSPSSSGSFIPIGHGPVIKQWSSYISGRDGLAASYTWWWYELFPPQSDAVGGLYLTDTWPRPFVISNLLRDVFMCCHSTFFSKKKKKTRHSNYFAFNIWLFVAERKVW